MDGIVLFNKPILWTSHDAVDFVRRRFGQRSVGHAGTLDPLATGLLIILLGKATKRSGEFIGMDKDYRGTLTLGITTDTQDLEGKILESRDAENISEENIQKVFQSLCGLRHQTPPNYSAARVNGKKLYDWSRQGVRVEAKPREIQIFNFCLLNFFQLDIHFFVSCSKGTYIRSLCDEAGKRLGCGATLSSLVRTRIGPFDVEKALTEKEMAELPTESIERRFENLLRN